MSKPVDYQDAIRRIGGGVEMALVDLIGEPLEFVLAVARPGAPGEVSLTVIHTIKDACNLHSIGQQLVDRAEQETDDLDIEDLEIRGHA